jgi:hypothetical protein
MKFQIKHLHQLFLLFFLALFSQNCNTPEVIQVTSKSVSFDKNAVVVEKKMDSDRWQQRAEYTMDVDFDHTQHQYKGKQKLVYFNNSPDALDKVFFHLYMNAFQPGSCMDVRSRTISDPDPRVTDRIFKLKPNEIGYLKVKNLTLNGVPCQFEHNGTILEVKLPKSIDPLTKVFFECEFEGQVSLQIRRNGRMNREGVDYSMAQWYPKMCEYDIKVGTQTRMWVENFMAFGAILMSPLI